MTLELPDSELALERLQVTPCTQLMQLKMIYYDPSDNQGINIPHRL